MDAQEMKDTARRWLTGLFDNGNFDRIIQDLEVWYELGLMKQIGAIPENA
jgi:hypothetical protein